MADNTTELEVLNQIVDVLGGQSGQHETVVPVLEDIRDLLSGGGGGEGGYNPSLSVGRADALTGADSTAQWATRESTGSGAATVRSVQGETVVWNQLVGADTSAVTIPSGNKYLSVIGGTSAIATSDGTAISVTGGTDQVFDLTQMFGSGNEPATVAEFEQMFPEAYYPYSAPTLKPVQIAGIQSKDANGDALDSVEWETQTLRAAGSVRDELTAGELVTSVGAVDLGTLTWTMSSDSRIDVGSYFIATISDAAQGSDHSMNKVCGKYTPIYDQLGLSAIIEAYGSAVDKISYGTANSQRVFVIDSTYTTAADFKAAMSGVPMFYELATPTTTPISPALPMTYRVQQGGTESIIVPEGEISVPPVLTIAEGESAADVVMDALACIATPDGPVATSNHALGTYLTMGGKLYKVTSAIAVGETIAAGTNVTATTVMAELLALAN